MQAIRLSKNDIKFFASLKIKKFRDTHSLFLAEGEKITSEALHYNSLLHSIIALPVWLKENEKQLNKLNIHNIYECSNAELERISSQKSPNSVIAVLRIIDKEDITEPNKNDGVTLMLDGIQDPGNLGTIIRMADWFGISKIICSHTSVELYNPKVIQSSMGAFLRVNIVYTDLEKLLLKINQMGEIVSYGAFLNGRNIYTTHIKKPAIIVIGNESQGISCEIEKLLNEKITIPSFSKGLQKTESLNAAIATAILCSEFARRP